MSEYENLVVERHGQVAVVALNRPDSLNAFNSAMLRDLLPAIAEVNDDASLFLPGWGGRLVPVRT